ncbi:AAA family ATPase, partial [Pediococcus damnosus]|uniref:AAA family ATPase n=1 Tax=Pediococcus damnosus TaxID=51663 RepID=UPI00187588D0
MYIQKLEVNNFRQLKNITINFEKNTSILAGPNNSGKTSLIQLMKRTLSDKKFNFNVADFNAYDQQQWLKQFDSIIDVLKKTNADKLGEKLSTLQDEMMEEDSKLLIPETITKWQINYSDKDDISKFVNYLMDLKENENSFYFICKITLNISSFLEAIVINLSKFNDNEIFKSKLLLKIYCEHIAPHFFFTDKKYKIQNEIVDQNDFHQLFNFGNIPAARIVEDFNNTQHTLSKDLISLTSGNEEWSSGINALSTDVLQTIQNGKLNKVIEDNSVNILNDVLKKISGSNGGHTGEISLNVDVSEDDVQKLIDGTTRAQYSYIGSDNSSYKLNETSQGLGYNNLIYLHTQIETFIQRRDEQKVNFLVIEEPESHMHPQMQNVFTQELLKIYDNKNLQGLITTHSTELVRGIEVNRLRVIRMETLFNSKVYDLSKFINKLSEANKENVSNEQKNVIENFKTFFKVIGFADILFADAAILFEGDTERLYLSQVINEDGAYEALKHKYIAYVQVGGAYAHTYIKLLKYLRVKSLILTDIDYDKKTDSIEKLMDTTITNGAILDLFRAQGRKTDNEKVRDIYKWLSKCKNVIETTDKRRLDGNVVSEGLIYLGCQTKEDKYTRTLEAAMLAKKFNLNPFERRTVSKWEKSRKESKLQFSIPKDQESTPSLIEILNSTSNGKTNFMFSVILNNQVKNMLLNYIQKGLNWF